MSVKAVREEVESIASDDFQALEDKVYRTIELLKTAREARVAAERDAARLREQLRSHNEEVESIRREVIELRRDREEVRSRVEKMLNQIDLLTSGESAR